jgi:hypothetical protein
MVAGTTGWFRYVLHKKKPAVQLPVLKEPLFGYIHLIELVLLLALN